MLQIPNTFGMDYRKDLTSVGIQNCYQERQGEGGRVGKRGTTMDGERKGADGLVLTSKVVLGKTPTGRSQGGLLTHPVITERHRRKHKPKHGTTTRFTRDH